MQPLKLAPYRNWQRMVQTREEMIKLLTPAEKLQLTGQENPSYETLKRVIDAIIVEEGSHPCYVNDVYQVSVRQLEATEHMGPMVHLSIRRLDREPVHDWRDFQEIKNQLVGPECEGVELYPAESRLMDTANQYHLWVFKDPTYRIPFGYACNRTVAEPDRVPSTARQRPTDATR